MAALLSNGSHLDELVGELEAGEDLGEDLGAHHHLGQVHAVLGDLAEGAANLKRGGEDQSLILHRR